MRRAEIENRVKAKLVNLADESISAGEGTRASGALISQALSKAGIAETVSHLGTGSFPSAAEIFDALHLVAVQRCIGTSSSFSR
ncbi:MAG: hypothetical protein NG747_07160 [Candidatus Brocadia sp.]|nr:hypothetical protein [Candidatus Brocadia sp.]